ncbi:MAG: type III pantothenate kinase [Erysipelothrix sp.]|nr:type III pantothenate kinase [Erysipelothrix sp.]
MLLTIDVGNSDIVTILYDEKKNIGKSDRRETIKKSQYSLYAQYIKDIKKLFNISTVNYIVSCVVPSISETLKEVLEDNLDFGYFIDYTSYPDISKLLSPPQEIGADLIAASVEVIENYDQPTIIIDMGTATKIIVVDKNTIIGVAILLGVKKNAKAIVQSIPHLPKVELKFPANVVGKTTIEAIQSGVMFSTIATINGYTALIEEHFENKVAKIITGGISRLFLAKLKDYEYKENLVNDGLYSIYHLKDKTYEKI